MAIQFKSKIQQARFQEAQLRYIQQIQEGWDVVLPPEDQAPLFATENADQVNWAIDYLTTPALLAKVIETAKAKKSKPIAIVITDTAPWFDHADLQAYARNDLGIDFATSGRTSKKADLNGHGTHCAGIVAAKSAQYRLGVISALAEAGLVVLIPVGVLNESGSGAYSWIASGYGYGLDLQKKLPGHRIIMSSSLGGNLDSDDVKQAIDLIIDKGIFVSASAGNGYGDGTKSTMGFPGRYKPVQAIGSIDQSEQRSAFSSPGNMEDHLVWVAAPGGGIFSTYKNGTHATLNGTSMANPASVAIDACLLLLYPEISNQAELKEFKAKFAKDLMKTGYDVFTGYGAPKLAGYVDQKPEDPNPEPEPEPENPIIDLFSFHAKASVVMRDHTSDPTNIFAEIGGYTFDVEIQCTMDNADRQNQLQSQLRYWVDTYFQFFRQMTIQSRQDPVSILSKRKFFIDGPATLPNLAKIFAEGVQKYFDQHVPEAKASVIGVTLDNNLGEIVTTVI